MPKTEIQIQNDSGGGKTTAILIVILVLAVSLLLVANGYRKYKAKYEAARDNSELLSNCISSLQDSAKLYKVKFADGQKRNVAQIASLAMTKENIEKLYSGKAEECKRLGIKLSNVKTITSAVTSTTETVTVPVYIDSLKQLNTSFNDGYLSLHNTIYRNNTSKIEYQYRDSFDLYNDIKQKHFLFFRWRKKTNRFTLVPRNPKTSILGIRVIEKIE